MPKIQVSLHLNLEFKVWETLTDHHGADHLEKISEMIELELTREAMKIKNKPNVESFINVGKQGE